MTDLLVALGLPQSVAADGAALLDAVADVLSRYVVFPSDAARDATVLWVAHAHMVQHFDSTPRLVVTSPEKGSGKTRLLEVLAELAPNARHVVNMTPAALFRVVSAGHAAEPPLLPTLLFDEADTYFGAHVSKHHEELRALVNAGHRKGAVAYRVVGEGANLTVREFPAFAAVALAGIGDLPDTIMHRGIGVPMRRRTSAERVEPFRHRKATPSLNRLRGELAAWACDVGEVVGSSEPVMPDGLTDRPADVWEPLIAIADEVGGDWPQRVREAATALTAAQRRSDTSLGVRLLADMRSIFEPERETADSHAPGPIDRIATDDVLKQLHEIEDAPWGSLRGRPLDSIGLARRLRSFGIRPGKLRIGKGLVRGYERGDFLDAWNRYLPSADRAEHPEHPELLWVGAPKPVPVPERDFGNGEGQGHGAQAAMFGTSGVPGVPGVPGACQKGGHSPGSTVGRRTPPAPVRRISAYQFMADLLAAFPGTEVVQ